MATKSAVVIITGVEDKEEGSREMTIDEREGAGFFHNDPRKLEDPFPDLKYFRENRPVYYYEPLDQWFIFGYDNVAGLLSDPGLSSVMRLLEPVNPT